MIEASYFWMNVAFLALGTIGIRVSLIAASAKIKISDRTKEIFSYIPAAILPAFIAPAVFFHEGHVTWLAGKERLF
ncbi:MAG: AzlD domain-containing protein, partial [Pseudobdellovibrionaceae bacterium]